MAKKYLTGDGNWSTPGNWKPAAALPGANDNIMIGPVLTSDTTDTVPEADDLDFDSVLVHRLYKKSFGTSGSPMLFAADEVKLYSGGPCYYDCDAGGAALKTDLLTIALANPNLICEIGGSSGDVGTIDWIRANRGTILLKSSIVFGAGIVTCGYVSNQSSDTQLTIDANAPTLGTLVVQGGICRPKNEVTLMHVCGGRVVKTDKKSVTTYIHNGGLVEYEFENTSTSDDIHVFAGGTLDLMTNEIPKTFGNVYVHRGAAFRYDPTLHTFGGTFGLIDMRDEVN